MATRKDLPTENSANFLARTRETLQTYLGLRGDKLDRGITLRDLVSSGIVKLSPGWLGGGGSTVPLLPGASVEGAYEPDLTPPPQPTGFAVSAAITTVFIEHNDPTYTQGHGHLRTQIYGIPVSEEHPNPTFSDAVVLGQFSGRVGSFSTNPATTWRLWIKWESNDRVLSATPAGGTNGLEAVTGQDVAKLLEALNGAITEGQLYGDLAQRIDLIDASAITQGSVAYRVAQEAQARAADVLAEAQSRAQAIADEAADRLAADQAEAQSRLAAIQQEAQLRNDAVSAEAVARAQAILNEQDARIAAITAEANTRAAALLAEANARGAAITSEQTARQTADESLASDITALTASVDGNAAAISSEATTRANADAAEATLRTTLATQMRGAYTGTNVNSVTTGLIYSERQARTTADTAITTSVTALSATVTANNSTLTASIVEEQTARASADSALAGTITALNATVGNNAAAIAEEAATRASADAAEASQRETLAATVAGNQTTLLGIIDTEAAVRADADGVEANKRESLSALLYGEPDQAASLDYVLGPSLDASFTGGQYAAFEAPSIDALTSGLIFQEREARATAIGAEVTERESLAAQMRGGYTGTDMAMVTSGLLYQERTARASADEALSQQITLFSAGIGEQFDYKNIWYFDSGVDSWFGAPAAPSATAGWLRPADGVGAFVISPLGLSITGATYTQVRARIRKTGSPPWEGLFYWRDDDDASWSGAKSITIDEPAYDANGIGMVTINPGWNELVDRIRLDLGSDQTATDYFEIDWVAVGRPSPGASSAALQEEQAARASADAAQVLARETLQAQLVGGYTGTDVGALTTGLIYSERQARASADTAITSSVTALTATVNTNKSQATAAITAEATARADADSSLSEQINVVSAKTDTKTRSYRQNTAPTANLVVGDHWFDSNDGDKQYRWSGSSWIEVSDARIASTAADVIAEQNARTDADSALANSIAAVIATASTDRGANTAAITAEQQARANADSALASDIASLSATTDENAAAILAEQTARANADASEATQRNTLATQMRGTYTGTNVNSLTTGLIYSERQARTTADTAISNSVTALAATVGTNTAAIASEQTARANADSALAESIESLAATVGSNTAAINTEATARADADTAIAGTVSALAAVVTGNEESLSALISSESQARVDADEANAQQITTLQSRVEGGDLSGFSPHLVYEFNGDMEGWSISGGGTGEIGETSVTITTESTFTYLIIGSANLPSFDGKLFNKVRARMRRLTGTAWIGNLLYGIAGGHGFNTSYQRDLPDMGLVAGGDWKIIEWDMEQLEAGGSDWTDNTINSLRFCFSALSGDSFEVDWVAIGSRSPGVSSAALQIEAETRASETGNLFAKYTVKVDVNGYVSGFGLASTANNASPFSEFAVRADRFYVASPSGPGISPIIPFVVQTTPTTINGVAVPVGVYMDAAFIKNGTITNAKIANLAVDGAKIADASIVTAKIADAQITAAKIKDANITTAKIQTGAITTALIGAAQITAAKIADANITSAKIADAAITSAKIKNAAIGEAHIVNGVITRAKIAGAAIDSARIADAAITSAKIGNAQINSAHIADASVGTLQVAGNAITAASFHGGASIAPMNFDVWYSLIDVTVYPEGGGIIGILIFTAYSFDVDSAGECTVLLNGNAIITQKFGVSTTSGGDTRYLIPVSIPFSNGGSSSIRIQASARSRQNQNGTNGLRIGIENVRLIVMSGKR